MTPPRVVSLTAQQRVVLAELMRDGASNERIARRLFLSEDTVKSHMKAVAAAFGISNRTAIALAYERGQVTVTARGDSRGRRRGRQDGRAA